MQEAQSPKPPEKPEAPEAAGPKQTGFRGALLNIATTVIGIAIIVGAICITEGLSWFWSVLAAVLAAPLLLAYFALHSLVVEWETLDFLSTEPKRYAQVCAYVVAAVVGVTVILA